MSAVTKLNRYASRPGTFAARILCAAAFLALAGCSQTTGYSNNSGEQPLSPASCKEVAASVIERARVGDTAGAINSEIQWLSENCDDEYDMAIDYMSMAGVATGKFGPETCDFLLEHDFHPESVRMLRSDGFCIGSNAPGSAPESPTQTQWPDGGLSWDQAASQVGTTQRVCGPLMSMRTSENDVFLNIGRDYPDSQRFTIIAWDVGNVEPEPPGLTICASGVITSYNGVAQIELYDVGQIEIWE